MTVVSDEELWVGKLLAFIDRTAPRDAWDVSRMPLIAPELARSPSLRRWFVAMSFILDHPLATYDWSRLSVRLNPEMTERQLRPMLTRDDRPESEGLLEKAWRVAEPLTNLTGDEAEFAARAQRAELHPALIFRDDEASAQRYLSHPQVVWKLRNLRKHLGLT